MSTKLCGAFVVVAVVQSLSRVILWALGLQHARLLSHSVQNTQTHIHWWWYIQHVSLSIPSPPAFNHPALRSLSARVLCHIWVAKV